MFSEEETSFQIDSPYKIMDINCFEVEEKLESSTKPLLLYDL